jgi:soluble lytic murein transglycosylase-like protein
VFARDVARGFVAVCHNSMALVGLGALALVLFLAAHDEVRHDWEQRALGWLMARHDVVASTPPETPAASATSPAPTDPMAQPLTLAAEPDAAARATAADPAALPRQQAAVAQWISRRYRVAPEPISHLVKEAWAIGARAGLDPTLILAIMAIESSFNPFAQSSVGAQGLMQVLTRVHDEKFKPFGGTHAAFDPITNLRVGVQVLKDCIARAGSLEAGLKYYVGAANLPDDGGYAGKVLAVQSHLKMVASGSPVPPTVRLVPLPLNMPVAANEPAADTGATVAPAERTTVEPAQSPQSTPIPARAPPADNAVPTGEPAEPRLAAPTAQQA